MTFLKKYFWPLLIILLFVTILYFAKTYYQSHSLEYNKPTPTPPPTITPTPIKAKARVTRVIDGDTIQLSTGEQVRYIGIDTPEENQSGKKGCFADEAKKTNIALVLNQEIELESDINDKDDYGRLLRYVYIEDIFVNEFLVRWGFARAETYFPEKRYRELFLEAQKEAKSQKRGLWGKCQ